MNSLVLIGLSAASLIISVTAHAQTTWQDRISLDGDLRFRYNHIQHNFYAKTVSDDNNQLRARLMAAAKVNEKMSAHFQLATNEGDYRPTSDEDTMGEQNSNVGTAQKSAFDLDLAYGEWKMCSVSTAFIGKAPNPFWAAGNNEMLFDHDLAFEGLATKWATEMGSFKPFANASYNWLAHFSNPGFPATNVMQLGLQAGASTSFGESVKATAAIAYHSFNNADQAPPTAFGYKASLLNVGAELGLGMVRNLPIAIYGDYVNNTASGTNSHENTGYIAGVSINGLKNVGSWNAWYNYRNIGAQAATAHLGEDEFSFFDMGGPDTTDIRGNELGASYMLRDNTALAVKYVNSTTPNIRYFERYIADINWKF